MQPVSAEHVKPAPEQIRRERADNPKMRERDLAAKLGISEAELVAAYCGDSALRIEPRVNDLLAGLEAVGEVMALTRNDSAVHEKIGVYDKVVTGEQSAMVLGADIDLRIFPKVWAHGFAVEKRDGDDIRRSLQFFDATGEAVHKVHLRAGSNLYAYQKLVASLEATDQSPVVAVRADLRTVETDDESVSPEMLRERWSKLTDTHQFFGMLRTLKISRRRAMHLAGPEFAWPLDFAAVSDLMNGAAESGQPIMCFVGSRGCIQIHSGPIRSVAPMGPWINVFDETFHLHLRADHIHETWAVRKPTKDGHVTSVEAYDAAGQLVIQFFGKRHEGEGEREDWRSLAERLPRIPCSTAA
jgi:putative hemin transport protein